MIVVDALTGHHRFTLRGHDSTVTCMKLFDNPFSASVCATGSYDGTVCVWDLQQYVIFSFLRFYYSRTVLIAVFASLVQWFIASKVVIASTCSSG